MCRMASFIKTKNKVFWSKVTDSHEEIIREFDLGNLDSNVNNVGLVRTEIVPPDNDYTRPLDEWEFNTDQDIVPEWYDAAKAERDCRVALEAWAAAKVITGERKIEKGNFVASGSASVVASGSASVEASGSASVRASGSASVEASGSASVRAYDSASVRASGSASVVASGSASVVASGSASVVASGSASVRASGSASVEASGSASVVASGSASVRAYDSASVTIPKNWAMGVSIKALAGTAIVIDRRNDAVKIVSACGIEVETFEATE